MTGADTSHVQPGPADHGHHDRGPVGGGDVVGLEGTPGSHEHGLTDIGYVKVALLLAVITGLEITLSYVDVGPLFLPALLVMMAVKFFTVVLYFMHLKFDNRIFTVLFYMGLLLAVGVYLAALLTFQFFDG
jgi:cytochrome c oxidase subunit 4